MKLVIAEKPSLAMNVVKSIGNMSKSDGYFENTVGMRIARVKLL